MITTARHGAVVHGRTRGPGVPTGECTGIVLDVVRIGCYLQLGDDVIAVLDEGAPAGPIHLVVRGRAPRPPTGSPVQLGGGLLLTDAGGVDVRQTLLHAPTVVDPPTWERIRRPLGSLRRSHTLRSEPLPAPERVAHHLRSGDLAGLARILAGRGGGLTPTGDDFLAGVLLGAHAAGSSVTRLTGIARTEGIGRLSAAFLRWAARGRTIAPVHDLLEAADRGDRDLDLAVRRVESIGATSGAALVAGLAAVARDLDTPA